MTTPDPNSLPGVRAAAWIHDRWPDLLAVIGTLCAGAGGLLVEGDAAKALAGEAGAPALVRLGIPLVVGGTIGGIVGAAGQIRRSKRTSVLERQLREAEAKAEAAHADLLALTDGYLYALVQGPLACRSTERVTIYAHDDDRKVFTLFGRVALNPDYHSKRRVDYPDTQGCIARAWRDGWAFANDYPDPRQNYDAYVKRALQDNVPQAEVDKIRMRARLFGAHRVASADGKRPLAVVVVESTDPVRYTEAELRSMFDQGGVGQYVSDLVERVAPRLPRAGVAGDAGY